MRVIGNRKCVRETRLKMHFCDFLRQAFELRGGWRFCVAAAAAVVATVVVVPVVVRVCVWLGNVLSSRGDVRI